MTWARAGQVTGESNSVDEFDIDTSLGGSNLPTVSNVAANTGTYSVRCGVYNVGVIPSGIVFSEAICVRASWWFRHNNANTNAPPIVRILDVGGVLATVTMSKSTVSLIVGGSTKESKTPAECGLDGLNTWVHCALTYYAHADDGYVTFYVNGTAVLSWDGAVVGSPTGVYIGGGQNTLQDWENYAYYDDLYVDTSSSAETDACPDALRFVPKLLDGTTSNVTWNVVGAATAHAALATNDGDTSYLGSIAVNDLFIGTLTDAVIPEEYIVSRVHTLDYAKRGDALSTVVTSLIDGSLNTDESAEMTPGTAYTRQWATFDLAPDGNAWNNTKVNDISLGVKSDGAFA